MAPQTTILLAALVTEGLLVIVSYVAIGLWDLPLTWGLSASSIAVGVAAVIPPVLLNELLWRVYGTRPGSVYGKFIREVILPLCKQVQRPTAVALAILSGFGEELFFRGVLHELTATNFGLLASAIITSILFAYVHFIGQVRRFGKLLPLYTGMGLYLWTVCIVSHSLIAAIVAHSLYNFTAIAITRHRLSIERRALSNSTGTASTGTAAELR
jgi:membrane protease YdiL (CAAX protease family)